MIQMIEAMLQICGIKGKMIDMFSLVLFMEACRHAQTKKFHENDGTHFTGSRSRVLGPEYV